MMSAEKKSLDVIARELEEQGYTVQDLIAHSGKKNLPLLKMPDECLKEYQDLYEKIDSGELNSTQKGRALERITELLFEAGGLFDCRRNYRTSTNELDLLLTWGRQARNQGIGNAFPCFGDMFICECKEYAKPLSVTFVGKFFSLLACSQVSFGVLVTWNGVSGQDSWSYSGGLIKKIALHDGVFIVSLDKYDLKKIYDGKENVYSLLMDKKDALQSDISYDKYIISHEAEALFPINNSG